MNDYYMQIYLFTAGDALINHWHHLKESDPPVHHLKEPVKSYPYMCAILVCAYSSCRYSLNMTSTINQCHIILTFMLKL